MKQNLWIIRTVLFLTNGYSFKGESLTLGAATFDGETIGEAPVKIALKL
jgi:hypothetical protein